MIRIACPIHSSHRNRVGTASHLFLRPLAPASGLPTRRLGSGRLWDSGQPKRSPSPRPSPPGEGATCGVKRRSWATRYPSRQDSSGCFAGANSAEAAEACGTVARRLSRGFLTTEVVVAMGILLVALLPLSYAFVKERQLSRALYYRAVAMEIVDGELDVLRAGAGRVFADGSHAYIPRAEAAGNLPPGRFVLTREGKRLRLEWEPAKRGRGGHVAREVMLP